MRSRYLAGGAAGALLLTGLALPAPASALTIQGAQLSVLHGIPGVPVDVWVNGELTLDDFQPTTLAGPLALPAGDYSVAITPPDATSAEDRPVIPAVALTLAEGGSYTAVAHLNPSDQPTATLFTNDISNTATGQGRLTVRHVAGAPAVDVLAGGQAVISGLTNPNEQVLNLPAATISASVAAAGTTEPLIGPADVPVQEGVNTIVYAYGSAAAGNLALAVQSIEGLHTPPAGVPAGQTGEAAAAADPTPLVGVIGLLLVSALVLVVGRRRAAALR